MRMIGKLALAAGATAAVLLAAPAAHAADADVKEVASSSQEAQPKLGVPLVGNVPVVNEVAGGVLGGLLGGTGLGGTGLGG
ncbi:hypothetical protein [Saccharothrix sp. Mg75]|uniref:hypothetical protein n=1 Tax=Saccharothrix sp. Mg75 TaxID=3445357 RepID=UPI003EEE67F3